MERSLLVKEVLACIAPTVVVAKLIIKNMEQQDKDMFGESNAKETTIYVVITVVAICAPVLIVLIMYKYF